MSRTGLSLIMSIGEICDSCDECVDNRDDSEKQSGIGNFHPINLGYSESNTNFVPTPLA